MLNLPADEITFIPERRGISGYKDMSRKQGEVSYFLINKVLKQHI